MNELASAAESISLLFLSFVSFGYYCLFNGSHCYAILYAAAETVVIDIFLAALEKIFNMVKRLSEVQR